MTGAEIITKFEGFVDDTMDATLALQLANDAMHEIEEEVLPECLKKTDTSKSTSVGQTYATALTLPTDFFLAAGPILVGTVPYTQIPLEQAPLYRDSSGYYYVDIANNAYHLTGIQGSVQTISFPYFYSTDDIDTNASPVWPARFHSLIPLKMAQMYFAIDGGDKARAWDDRWNAFYTARLRAFKEYDADLKLAGMNYATTPTPIVDSENRVNY